MVDGDTINGLIDYVRAETEADLLSQAETLLDGNAIVAATVIAGGALETHLRGVIERFGIPWQGDRGIATYNNAIASHRNKNLQYEAALQPRVRSALTIIRVAGDLFKV